MTQLFQLHDCTPKIRPIEVQPGLKGNARAIVAPTRPVRISVFPYFLVRVVLLFWHSQLLALFADYSRRLPIKLRAIGRAKASPKGGDSCLKGIDESRCHDPMIAPSSPPHLDEQPSLPYLKETRSRTKGEITRRNVARLRKD
jgi:hypothetical protein